MSAQKTHPAHEGPVIHLTEGDLERLRALVDQHATGPDAAAAERLEAELDRAVVVPSDQAPRDVVTMNSQVVFEDETGTRREIWLVYPWEADPSHGRVSVLAPVGAAVLGLSVGQTIDWPLPGDRTAELTIVEVLSQPEQAARPGA